MVKGVSRRVIVVDSPDPRFFEQAIFIVRNDALEREGISRRQILDEACRVAQSYARTHTYPHARKRLSAPLWIFLGAAGLGLVWLLTALF